MPEDDIRQQQHRLWLCGHDPIETESEAAAFLKSVGFALRYNATPALPLASMYKAVGGTRRAIELTNGLLGSGEAIETNVIAERLVLAHRTLVPWLYALRKRRRSPELSLNARKAFDLILQDDHASAGDVRRFLGVTGSRRPDGADVALAELQREMLIDRGPSSIPKKGIPYLSPEGYPYRVFENAHPDIVRTAGKMKPAAAVTSFLGVYLNAATPVPLRKLGSMFKLLFDENEMTAAIAELAAERKVLLRGKVVSAAAGLDLN